MLVNMRLHMMFPPETIYIFELTVNLIMRYLKIDVWVLKNRYKTTDWIPKYPASLKRH